MTEACDPTAQLSENFRLLSDSYKPVDRLPLEPATPPPFPIGEVQRLSLKPSDIIVFELSETRVSQQQASEVKRQIQQCFPDHQVIVTVGGHLRILDRQQPKPPADASWVRSTE